jgi:hypothetical protein
MWLHPVAAHQLRLILHASFNMLPIQRREHPHGMRYGIVA